MSAIVTAANVLGGSTVAAVATNVGWFVPMLVAALAYFQYEEIMSPESRPIDIPSDQLLDEYDFIIVGAGSAGEFKKMVSHNKMQFIIFPMFCVGAVLANRLTEVENWNVLLLEAGGDETEISDVPLMAGFLQLSKLDWKYKTEPQGSACLGTVLTLNLASKNVF